MRPYFQTHALAGALFWATVIGWAVLEVRQSSRTRSGATSADRGSRQTIRATFIVAWVIAFVATADVPKAAVGHRGALFVVSLLLMWSGIALRFWAFQTLGQYFTFTVMTSTDQQVVTAGPYRLIRHPGYAGGTLAFVGVGLTFGNWIAFASMAVIPLIGIVNRIMVEEGALVGTLGDAYSSYAVGRKRLVPFLW